LETIKAGWSLPQSKWLEQMRFAFEVAISERQFLKLWKAHATSNMKKGAPKAQSKPITDALRPFPTDSEPDGQ
jgi:hypothetical protein